MSYYYLASPYSHPDPAVRTERYIDAERAVVWLLKKNMYVYSPIVHCHHLSINHNLPTEFTFWSAYNTAMIKQATRIFVLMLKGVRSSKGVQDEIEIARGFGIGASLLYPPSPVLGNGEDYMIITEVRDLLSYDPQNPKP